MVRSASSRPSDGTGYAYGTWSMCTLATAASASTSARRRMAASTRSPRWHRSSGRHGELAISVIQLQYRPVSPPGTLLAAYFAKLVAR